MSTNVEKPKHVDITAPEADELLTAARAVVRAWRVGGAVNAEGALRALAHTLGEMGIDDGAR